jgi:hypothetical protein
MKCVLHITLVYSQILPTGVAAIKLIRKLAYFVLTPRGRALFEKVTGSQLVKEFPAFYGTLRFITAFTTARRLTLS